MHRAKLKPYIDGALDGLKDFQVCTTEAVYESLFEEGRRCMLVADEVGLGKTIVARGLIARILKKRISEGRRSPYKVTYICSNQVIAQENLRKLNLFPQEIYMRPAVSRIAYLARDDEEQIPKDKARQRLLELNTLTPATSFNIRNAIGTKDERAILYALLCLDLKMRNRRKGLGWLLKGGVYYMDRYRRDLEAERKKTFRKDLPTRFIRKLKRESLPKDIRSVYDHLPGRRHRRLYEAVVEFAEILDGRNEGRLHQGCLELTRRMRRILIRCCLRYVDADLFILDEFQRFRDLIDEESEKEQAVIARKVFFSSKKTRVLLLSATPFKAFTGYDDLERGDDHYRDFGKVLSFLLRENPKALHRYEQHRQALYKQILDLRSGSLDLTPQHRREVEGVLRTVMCRTERYSVADDPNALIHDTWKEERIPFSRGDIENFRLTDQIACTLEQLDHRPGKPVEYCKSALYPLSYMDRYKMKEVLKKHRNDPNIQADLRNARNGWLDLGKINSYRWAIDGGSKDGEPENARLKMLSEKAIGDRGAELLWIPPSLPYYDLEGSFVDAEGFSKTLLFSSWIMVPRMVATLISYEVERRTIGSRKTVENQEKGKRIYFTPENRQRHPIQQIRYTRRSTDAGAQLANMSNFTLLYPSLSLCRSVNLVENLRKNRTLGELKNEISQRISNSIERYNLKKFVSPEAESDRWYWAAPLLLDRGDRTCYKTADRWFGDGGWDRETFFKKGSKDAGLKEKHARFLQACFYDPAKAGLGPIPRNLPEVMAELALGSPAILALRSLTRNFPDEDESALMIHAFDVGNAFVTLFNKPEPIAAVRMKTRRKRYWRMVADYCASGCLQSVLDEYFHLLSGQNVGMAGALKQLLGAINLTASTINVDSLRTFEKSEPRRMRCHYAVEFGSQKIETDEGRERAASLREVFNSPFRPFLLATTSIGQEGLDFHSYCRRVVHWNLPRNPIDLEQREGRINRYKGLVIRQHLASKYRKLIAGDPANLEGDIWEALFQIADQKERKAKGKCELVPYWHSETDDIKIERVIPMYPFSKDQGWLEHILRTLTVYRLAFGQPRQAELVDYLLEHNFTEEELQKITRNLMIDLSPISYKT